MNTTSPLTLRLRDALPAATLWSAETLLTVVFGFAGIVKLALPVDDLAASMALPAALVRFIGIAELAAAVSLDPLVAKIAPKLTALAAAGLTTVMVLAAGYHFAREELFMIPTNIALGLVAAYVAKRHLVGESHK